MSWSVRAIGKPAAVGAAIAKQFDSCSPCSEPEETVRQGAKAAILKAVEAQDPGLPVSVSAQGSQEATYYDGKWGAPYTIQLSLEVKPLYGFVE